MKGCGRAVLPEAPEIQPRCIASAIDMQNRTGDPRRIARCQERSSFRDIRRLS